MKRLLITVAFFVGVVAGPALANETYQTCAGKAGDDAAIGQCGRDWIAREVALLDAAWQRLSGIVEGETAEKLKVEQDAWQVFRDNACTFYDDPNAFGDEVRLTEKPQCEARTVAARVAELKSYLRVIDP